MISMRKRKRKHWNPDHSTENDPLNQYNFVNLCQDTEGKGFVLIASHAEELDSKQLNLWDV